MTLLKIIEKILGLVEFLTKQAERHQWMDAGATKKTLNDIHASKKTIANAKTARANAKLDAISLRDSKNNRD